MTKMTKKEMFTAIANRVADDAEMVEFLNHEIDLLSRKHSSSKPTKAQIENMGIKSNIVDVLKNASTPMRVTEIAKVLDDDLTPQKVSALCSQLVLDGTVTKTMDKKVALFSVVA